MVGSAEGGTVQKLSRLYSLENQPQAGGKETEQEATQRTEERKNKRKRRERRMRRLAGFGVQVVGSNAPLGQAFGVAGHAPDLVAGERRHSVMANLQNAGGHDFRAVLSGF